MDSVVCGSVCVGAWAWVVQCVSGSSPQYVPDGDWGRIVHMMDHLKVFQLNCHNAHQSHTELKLKMSGFNNVISLIQEPYVNNKKTIANCPQGYDSFPSDRSGHRRTAIFSSRHLKLTEINEFCNNNMTCLLYTSPSPRD